MKDWNVSQFNNVISTIPKDFSLLEWLQMTKDPPQNYRKLVEKYQNSMIRKDKEKIPCITIHANFHTKREEANIKERNNLICLDIDRKENKCIDMQLLKELLAQHPSTLYAGFSVSGEYNGVFAIIILGHNDRLLDYFEYFKNSFQKIGVNIDSKCKDYSRLRFFNIDEDAYINTNAKPFTLEKSRKVTKSHEKSQSHTKSHEKSQEDFKRITNAEKVHKIIEQVETHGIDITVDYNDWVKIGAALAREFGEDGRSMFHRLSNKNSGYNSRDCDKKFDSCKRMNKINLSSLFFIAESYGIRY